MFVVFAAATPVMFTFTLISVAKLTFVPLPNMELVGGSVLTSVRLDGRAMHLGLPGAPTTAPSVRWRAAVVLVTLLCGGAHGGARSSKKAGSPSQPHPKPSA